MNHHADGGQSARLEDFFPYHLVSIQHKLVGSFSSLPSISVIIGQLVTTLYIIGDIGWSLLEPERN